ncbi:hypothetical protein C0Q70_09274 [Pomacea canaliculata]|uniref:Uncharacterized protein n=1 Tax=Pomacea canaliculata TaxID=400727 RepID=A0A2T7P9B9_POMCA|nr:hypothetical protein C0Q70_09274 [Pomacea canaliculata]
MAGHRQPTVNRFHGICSTQKPYRRLRQIIGSIQGTDKRHGRQRESQTEGIGDGIASSASTLTSACLRKFLSEADEEKLSEASKYVGDVTVTVIDCFHHCASGLHPTTGSE